MNSKRLKFLYSVLMIFITLGTAWANPPEKKTLKATSKKSVHGNSVLTEGSKYVLANAQRTKLLFTRKYVREKGGRYITTYHIYDEQKHATAVIVAVHNKRAKTIEVKVKDLQTQGFPIVNVEKTEYELPYMGRFGSVGKVGAIGKGKSKKDAPAQLSLSFVSKKFDFVRVVSIADAHEDSGKELEVFELDR